MAAITIWVPSTCSNIRALGKELVGVRQGSLTPPTPHPNLRLPILCQPPRKQIGSLELGNTAPWKGNDIQ